MRSEYDAAVLDPVRRVALLMAGLQALDADLYFLQEVEEGLMETLREMMSGHEVGWSRRMCMHVFSGQAVCYAGLAVCLCSRTKPRVRTHILVLAAILERRRCIAPLRMHYTAASAWGSACSGDVPVCSLSPALSSGGSGFWVVVGPMERAWRFGPSHRRDRLPVAKGISHGSRCRAPLAA